MTVPFFFWVVIFSGGSKNIAGQTTVPFFFWVVIFSGRNWCSYFDTSTNYGTYIWPETITIRKKGIVQSSGRPCFSAGSNYNRKKLRPEKKTYWSVGNWKKLHPEKKGTVVSRGSRWLDGGQNTKHNTHHRHNNQQDEYSGNTLRISFCSCLQVINLLDTASKRSFVKSGLGKKWFILYRRFATLCNATHSIM